MYSRFKFIFLLFTISFFSSCVDNSYDFDRIDTDNISVGDNWNAPLGTLKVSMQDVVNTDEIPSLFINSDGEYFVKYSSSIDLGTTVNDLIRSTSLIVNNVAFADKYFKLATTEFIIDHYENTFGDKFTIGIENPHIILKSNLTSASDLPFRLDIKAHNSENTISTTNDFTLNTATPNAWISKSIPTLEEIKQVDEPENISYDFDINTRLSDMLAMTPEKLVTSLWLNPKDLQMNSVSLSNVEFVLGFPLTPSPKFYAETTRLINDVFDEDIFSSVLSEGEFSLYGTIENKMPTTLKVELLLLDETHNEIGLKIESNTIEVGGSGRIRLDVNEADMERMKQARHIKAHFTLVGTDDPKTLSTSDFAKINLKVSKSKGIKLD